MLNNIRIKFVRGDEVKYISHLDLMKVFERALRRSRLPIAYSQGFNPHPQMVFGLPLSVGVTSEAEYADFDLTAYIEPAEFISRLNGELPRGLRIFGADYMQTKDNIMSSIIRASYYIFVCVDKMVVIDNINAKIRDFMQTPEIIIQKEGKSGIKDVNIKPMIHKLAAFELQELSEHYSDFAAGIECGSDRRVVCISAFVSAGSAANLKPDLLVKAMNEVTGLDLKTVKIHRTELYTGKEGRMINPLGAEALRGI